LAALQTDVLGMDWDMGTAGVLLMKIKNNVGILIKTIVLMRVSEEWKESGNLSLMLPV